MALRRLRGPAEDIGEPSLRVDVVTLGGTDQRVHRRGRSLYVRLRLGQHSPLLQELGGWSDAAMVRSYAHLSADHLVTYADNLSGVPDRGHNIGHSGESECAAFVSYIFDCIGSYGWT